MHDDADSLHVEIDNLNNLLVEFCFIKSMIDRFQTISHGHDCREAVSRSIRKFLLQKRIIEN
jgi:hypothetical protein